MELIKLGDGSSSVSILTQISWYNNFNFDSYFSNLDLLKVIFIFVTSLSVSWMDRYKEINLKRKDNRCGRVKIIVLETNGEISWGKGKKRREKELHVHIKEMHTHKRETELKEEEEELKQRE
jgi:hypothetical protein